MIRAFYSGTSGMKTQQAAVDIISNNIANSNTNGYKSKTASFGDLLYSAMVTYPQNSVVGNGVRLAGTSNDMSDGGPQETGLKTDFFIDGQGFFAVRDAAGNTFYTRDGSFRAEQGQSGPYLADSEGRQVLDSASNPIAVNANGDVQNKPGVFSFSNSPALSPAGDNLFTPTAASGNAQAANTIVRTGYLESSNVDLAKQMTDLLQSQRSFQMNSKMVQTADEIVEMVNQLR